MPETLGRNSTQVWSFLTNLPAKWDWLKELYGSAEEFRESLCAYYLVLNIIEFVDTIAEGREEILQQEEVMLDIPLSFLQEGHEILRRAYLLALADPLQVREIWKSKNVPESKVKELWPRWVSLLRYWLGKGLFYGLHGTVIHEKLLDDMD